VSPAPEERWTTIAETAVLLKRSPKTIRNLVFKHGLPRRLIRQGRSPRRMMLLSETTRERLRRLCWSHHDPGGSAS
jgi:hypothetical protein